MATEADCLPTGTCVTSGDMNSICSITFILTGPVSKQARSQIQTLIPKIEPGPHGPHGKKSERTKHSQANTVIEYVSNVKLNILPPKKKRYRSCLKYMWIIAAFKWEDKKKKSRREGKMSTRVQTTQGGLLSGSASPGLEQMLASYLEPNLPACFYK